MGTPNNLETHIINYHLKKIFSDLELYEISVVRNFRITATDGIKILLEKNHLKSWFWVSNFDTFVGRY